MGPHVSVIVPIYNVEAYIHQCIKSILSQSYQDFELILVDDGSPDHCGEICDHYARIDNRIRVIHKKNGGLSDARNVGIDIACGDFLTFIDSDDCISSDYLELLVKTQQKYGADIVQGEMTRNIGDLGNVVPNLGVDIMSPAESFRDLLCFKRTKVYACGKLFKKSLILAHSLYYPVGRLNEDCATTYKMILQSNKVVLIPNVIYFYRINENSILNSAFKCKRFELWGVPTEMQDYLGEDRKNFEHELQYYKFRVGVNLINESIQSCDLDVERYRNEILRQVKNMSLNKDQLDSKYKLIYGMIRLNPKLYCMIIKTMRRGK